MIYRGQRLKRITSWVFGLMGRFCRLAGIPVLVYHSVDSSGSVISISANMFKAQMECLKYGGYRTISVQRFVEYLGVGVEGQPEKAVVLTFDDGFKNNYTEAFPILRDYGFTCTIFLPTDHVGKTCDWEKNKSIPQLPLLSWKEIEEMSEQGVEFGSHGCSHSHLTQLPRGEVNRELLRSKSIIEEKLGKKVYFFCHPYGDTNDVTQQVAKECGYLGAFGGIDFSLANNKDELYDLKRIGTAHFSSIEDFKACLVGTYDWYIRIKRLLVSPGSGG